MILSESRNLEWIEKAAKDNNVSNPQALEELAAARIPASFSSRLNNLKTQNPEAFFYWLKTSELMQ